ncbi:MAG: DUF1097 domain-containing protein [Acidiphilium sp.]|nr:DUF1097 domain-containing protein [Acidiphilium sp.]MDD4936460.1 DUF1097 domain-containing protein [Acidiphilium sp.]
MSLVVALAITIGVMGGIATFAVLGPLVVLNLQIWAMFLAWACFYHTGGKEAGLKTTITNNVFGAVMAWVALLMITHIPLGASLGLPAWAGICVGATVFVLILAANIPALSVIPAGFYGYAATAAYALVGGHLATLTSVSVLNPLIVISLSLIVGAALGYVSEKIAGSLTKPAVAAYQQRSR